MITSRPSPFALVACHLILAGSAAAQPPHGYYDSVDQSSPENLRASLHDIIDDHTFYPYTDPNTDTWDILNSADEDPADTGKILDVYKNTSYTKETVNYNRELTWPRAYGFPIYTDSPPNYPHTDCHHIMLSDSVYNLARQNLPYGTCSGYCEEYATEANHGEGGGTGVYPGNSNWRDPTFGGVWETWIGRRGDVARAMFYMDVRYEGGTHGVTGAPEPDLVLTDYRADILSTTSNTTGVAYMGLLSVLLQWHEQDPPTAAERLRNNVVANFQGNRNPFVDHPEWVECVFTGSNCPLLFIDGFESGSVSAWSASVP